MKSIQFKFLDEVFYVDIRKEDTVIGVKKKIFEKFELVILGENQALDKNKLLEVIEDGNILSLQIKKRDSPKIDVMINYLDQQHRLSFEKNLSIENVKLVILEKLNINPSKLVGKGQIFEDEKTLEFYGEFFLMFTFSGVKNGDILFIIGLQPQIRKKIEKEKKEPKEIGIIKIVVKISGENRYFNVKENETVHNLKEMIRNKYGISVSKLLGKGKVLEDNRSFKFYEIMDNDRLFVIEKEKSRAKYESNFSVKSESSDGVKFRKPQNFVVPNNSHESFNFEKLNECFYLYNVVGPSSFDRILEMGLEISNSSKIPDLISTALLYCGLVHEYKGNLSRALELLERGLGITKTESTKVKILNTMGTISHDLGNLQKAEDCFERSKIIVYKTDDYEGIGVVMYNIALLNSTLGNKQKTIDNLIEGEKYSRKCNDKKQLGSTLARLGYEMESSGLPGNKFALEKIKEGLNLSIEMKDDVGQGTAYEFAGNFYKRIKDYKNSLNCYFKSLKIRKDSKDEKNIARLYNNLANLELVQNPTDSNAFKKVFSFLNQSILKMKGLGMKNGLHISQFNMGICYFQQGQNEKIKNNHALSLKSFSKSLKRLNESIRLFKELKITNSEYLHAKNYRKVVESSYERSLLLVLRKQLISKKLIDFENFIRKNLAGESNLKGSMSKVYSCNLKGFKDTFEIDFRLALKVLYNYGYNSDDLIRKHLVESEKILPFLKSKTHPSIFHELGVFIDNIDLNLLTEFKELSIIKKRTGFFVFQKLKCNLEQEMNNLNKMGNISDVLFLSFAENLISGCNFMFQNGIVHRDIKLDNIFVTDKRSLDWGCKLVCQNFKVKYNKFNLSILGNVKYSAPEIKAETRKLGEGVDEIEVDYTKSDLFSVGYILYEIRTKMKSPFNEKLLKKGEYKYIELDKTYNVGIKDLLSKLLKTNPKERIGQKDALKLVRKLFMEENLKSMLIVQHFR